MSLGYINAHEDGNFTKYVHCVESGKRIYGVSVNGIFRGLEQKLCDNCRPKWSARVKEIIQGMIQ